MEGFRWEDVPDGYDLSDACYTYVKFGSVADLSEADAVLGESDWKQDTHSVEADG